MSSPFGLAAAVMALSLSSAAFAQSYDDSLAAVGECRAILEQADIDGVSQPVAARACLQPDGTWQIVRDDEDSSVIVYPVAAYPYPDPWYWGPPIFVGIGASFVFVDRFHHFHHFHRMEHAHFGEFHPGGFHSRATMPHEGFHGGMHGFGGGHHR
ncbi:hypothetical protein [Caballeronia ptereochthonis]|uniref:Lipoprotein n=1 Tax=Caballeronia ptereochthonis TaxID=1777144 RepID=A0A158AE95_9BURK|nr:hypothetical protein [Caballeronia ptereochthonis]SAK56045.1 hypothetical protein AWB83_01727 [Caballeronia ptereochthonis]